MHSPWLWLLTLLPSCSALANVVDRFAEWSKLDSVYSFLDSEQIGLGINQLFGELRWCGRSYGRMDVPAAKVSFSRLPLRRGC